MQKGSAEVDTVGRAFGCVGQRGGRPAGSLFCNTFLGIKSESVVGLLVWRRNKKWAFFAFLQPYGFGRDELLTTRQKVRGYPSVYEIRLVLWGNYGCQLCTNWVTLCFLVFDGRRFEIETKFFQFF